MPNRKYVCEMCHGEFETGWTDEAALAEAKEKGHLPERPEDRAVVCDDCYRILEEAYARPDGRWRAIGQG